MSKKGTRLCKNCKTRFKVKGNEHWCCTWECALIWTKKQDQKKREKESKAKTKEMKEALKTHKDYVQEVQVVFNRFVRLRDEKKGCISCGRPLVGKYDAGHFFSQGGNPELRLDEDNCHGQCVHCNQHRHGAIHDYTDRLPQRIGKERYEALKQRRGVPKKYSIPELIELKVIYKEKIKQLKRTL